MKSEKEFQKMAEHIRKVKRKALDMLPPTSRVLLSASSAVGIAGGFLASLLHEEVPNDFDFFILKHGEASNRLIKNYMKLYYDASELYEAPHLQNRYIVPSTRLTTIDKLIYRNVSGCIPEQYIFTSGVDTFEDLVNDFDYKHCRSWLWFDPKCNDYKINVSPETYDLIMAKKLILVNPDRYNQNREQRFFARGWSV